MLKTLLGKTGDVIYGWPLAPLFKAINQMKHKLETSFTISLRGIGPVNFTWNESDVVT